MKVFIWSHFKPSGKKNSLCTTLPFGNLSLLDLHTPRKFCDPLWGVLIFSGTTQFHHRIRDPTTAPVVHDLSREKQLTLKLNNKLVFETYASIHHQRCTVHARVMLLLLILWEMVQTLPSRRDSIQKWRWLTLSLGIKPENKTFPTFHMHILEI